MSGYFVYAIRMGNTDFVKIGTARDPFQRKRELQTGSPYPLHVVGLTDGSTDRESEIHKDLAKYHVRGEWFTDQGGQVAEYFRALKLPPRVRWRQITEPPFQELTRALPDAVSQVDRFYVPNVAPRHLTAYRRMIESGLRYRDVRGVISYVRCSYGVAKDLVDNVDVHIREMHRLNNRAKEREEYATRAAVVRAETQRLRALSSGLGEVSK